MTDASLAAVTRDRDRLREALRPIVAEYDLWADGADNGEFQLWDLAELTAAIVAARAVLRTVTPREG